MQELSPLDTSGYVPEAELNLENKMVRNGNELNNVGFDDSSPTYENHKKPEQSALTMESPILRDKSLGKEGLLVEAYNSLADHSMLTTSIQNQIHKNQNQNYHLASGEVQPMQSDEFCYNQNSVNRKEVLRNDVPSGSVSIKTGKPSPHETKHSIQIKNFDVPFGESFQLNLIRNPSEQNSTRSPRHQQKNILESQGFKQIGSELEFDKFLTDNVIDIQYMPVNDRMLSKLDEVIRGDNKMLNQQLLEGIPIPTSQMFNIEEKSFISMMNRPAAGKLNIEKDDKGMNDSFGSSLASPNLSRLQSVKKDTTSAKGKPNHLALYSIPSQEMNELAEIEEEQEQTSSKKKVESPSLPKEEPKKLILRLANDIKKVKKYDSISDRNSHSGSLSDIQRGSMSLNSLRPTKEIKEFLDSTFCLETTGVTYPFLHARKHMMITVFENGHFDHERSKNVEGDIICIVEVSERTAVYIEQIHQSLRELVKKSEGSRLSIVQYCNDKIETVLSLVPMNESNNERIVSAISKIGQQYEPTAEHSSEAQTSYQRVLSYADSLLRKRKKAQFASVFLFASPKRSGRHGTEPSIGGGQITENFFESEGERLEKINSMMIFGIGLRHNGLDLYRLAETHAGKYFFVDDAAKLSATVEDALALLNMSVVSRTRCLLKLKPGSVYCNHPKFIDCTSPFVKQKSDTELELVLGTVHRGYRKYFVVDVEMSNDKQHMVPLFANTSILFATMDLEFSEIGSSTSSRISKSFQVELLLKDTVLPSLNTEVIKKNYFLKVASMFCKAEEKRLIKKLDEALVILYQIYALGNSLGKDLKEDQQVMVVQRNLEMASGILQAEKASRSGAGQSGTLNLLVQFALQCVSDLTGSPNSKGSSGLQQTFSFAA